MIDLINRIPIFCQEFVKSLSDGILTLVGNYYLGDKYEYSFLESLPVCNNHEFIDIHFIKYLRENFDIYILDLQNVKEKVLIDGKEKDISRILLVSDVYICLFEQEKWTKNNLLLTFWSNLRSLVTIKKTINGDICKFYWKQKNKKVKFFNQDNN